MLLKKLFNVGFEDVAVVDRMSFGLDELRRYPLFAPEFIDFLRRVMPEHRQRHMVFSIVATGRKSPHPSRRPAAQ